MSKAEDLLWVSQVAMLDDRRAFDRLVQKHQSSVRRFLLNLTAGDAPLADDLSQDTFIKAYLHIRSFRGGAAFSTWLFRIAYRVFYDWVRTRKVHDTLDAAEVDKKNSTNIAYFAEKSDIYTAMEQLRQEERAAILLCYMEDYTQQEAAKIMNIPIGTVKTYILKGKEKMGQFLTQHGYGR